MIDREYEELRKRQVTDPQFNMMFQMVYRSIGSGDTSIQDWRDAVNLAYTEWHARNIGPIGFITPQGQAEAARVMTGKPGITEHFPTVAPDDRSE